MASHTPSEPTLQSGQDMTEADACQGLSSGSGLRQAVDDLTGPNDASGVQLPSSAASAVAGGQSATEQPGGHLPNGRTDKPAQVQQAEFNDLQAASMPAAPPAALLQPSPAATQPGYSAPASQAGVPRNGQGPASLSGARTNGVAVSSAAAQMAGVSTEPHLAAATAASRDHQLQAAALEGTATKSQAAISAGLSLVTPRSGKSNINLRKLIFDSRGMARRSQTFILCNVCVLFIVVGTCSA